MSTPLPAPVTTADCYAAALLDAVTQLNTTLGDIRDRLPAPAVEPVAVEPDIQEPVAVREPAPGRKPFKTQPRKAGR